MIKILADYLKIVFIFYSKYSISIYKKLKMVSVIQVMCKEAGLWKSGFRFW